MSLIKSTTLIFSVIILSVVSAFSFAEDQKRVASQSEQYGRYVITYSPFARADTFLLDTQTGKVWQYTQITDVTGKPFVWANIDRIDNEAEYLEWFSRQHIKPPPQ